MTWWMALTAFCTAFLGAFIGAAWGSYPGPDQPPRHANEPPQTFPVDLDELDQRHRGHGKDEL